MNKINFFMLLLMWLPYRSQAQQSITLKEAVNTALQNNGTVKNAQLDVEAAKARIKETTALGLPQISFSGSFQHSPTIQSAILENAKGSPFYSNLIPDNQIIAFQLALKNVGIMNLTWNQLLFDGSYLVGLRAAAAYKDLSNKNLTVSKEQVTENVVKTYYLSLVSKERLALLDVNISRLDSTIKEMRAMYNTGFIEKIDLDRLEVSQNNLKSERMKAERSVALTLDLLRFYMGLDSKSEIKLADKLDINLINNAQPVSESSINYSDRPDYAVLSSQKVMAELDYQNVKSGYLPKLYGQGVYGGNTGASSIGNITKSDRWYSYSSIGVSLTIPVFDSFQKHYLGQQKQIDLRKIDNGFEQLKQGIDLQVHQANTNLVNGLESLKIQQRNLELAKEVLRVSRVKYQSGIGSNLEVVNAEASLRETQINYYNSIYDAIVAKVDLDKATGKLLENYEK